MLEKYRRPADGCKQDWSFGLLRRPELVDRAHHMGGACTGRGRGGFLVFPNLTTDAIGFALTAGFYAWRLAAARRAGQGGRAAA